MKNLFLLLFVALGLTSCEYPIDPCGYSSAPYTPGQNFYRAPNGAIYPMNNGYGGYGYGNPYGYGGYNNCQPPWEPFGHPHFR